MQGLPPPCRRIVACGSLTIPTDESDRDYATNCHGIPAGGHCSVVCDGGWANFFSWLKRSSTFQCPAGNLDSTTQPHGVLPRCGFFDSDDPVLPAVVAFAAVAAVGLATWALIVIITGSSCCCTATSYTAGTKLRKTKWYREKYHPDEAVQKEIDEAEQAEIVRC